MQLINMRVFIFLIYFQTLLYSETDTLNVEFNTNIQLDTLSFSNFTVVYDSQYKEGIGIRLNSNDTGIVNFIYNGPNVYSVIDLEYYLFMWLSYDTSNVTVNIYKNSEKLKLSIDQDILSAKFDSLKKYDSITINVTSSLGHEPILDYISFKGFHILPIHLRSSLNKNSFFNKEKINLKGQKKVEKNYLNEIMIRR